MCLHGFSLHTFRQNYTELTFRLELFGLPEAIMRFWDERRRNDLTLYQVDIVRLLHNFLAAAMTLVDHTRILTRNLYQGTELLTKVQSQISEQFVGSPLAQFVQGLRNYSLHCALPLTLASLNFMVGAQSGPKSRICLGVARLHKWDGWKSKAKEYLDGLKDDPELLAIVKQYADLVLNFHSWFISEQEMFHKKEFDELAKLQAKLREALEQSGSLEEEV
jgi:hypothetical protein